MADEAMRSGKVIIQDAKGFFEWAISSSMKNVKFKFVPRLTRWAICPVMYGFQSRVDAFNCRYKFFNERYYSARLVCHLIRNNDKTSLNNKLMNS
jgi:hypothetical protein